MEQQKNGGGVHTTCAGTCSPSSRIYNTERYIGDMLRTIRSRIR
jgi:hypothetical protein